MSKITRYLQEKTKSIIEEVRFTNTNFQTITASGGSPEASCTCRIKKTKRKQRHPLHSRSHTTHNLQLSQSRARPHRSVLFETYILESVSSIGYMRPMSGTRTYTSDYSFP